MKIREIYDFIDSFAPFCTQLDFDNAGFLIGNMDEELKKAVVALDVTESAIDYAERIGANLIITHHPVIFEPLKTVLSDSLVFKLIKSGISVISAHTNLDMAKGGINDTLCDLIGLKSTKPILPEGEVYSARMGKLNPPLDSQKFAELLKEKLGARVKFTARSGEIKTVAVCSGSGGSMLEEVYGLDADAFVTADVKHDRFLLAMKYNIALFDCGHYETEDIIINPLSEKLSKKFGDLFFPFHPDAIFTV